MFLKRLSTTEAHYSLINPEPYSCTNEEKELQQRKGLPAWCRILSMCSLCIFILVATFAFGILLSTRFSINGENDNASIEHAPLCREPAVRQEWRSLRDSQKENYLQAVQCLRMKPSRILSNQTLFEDFPWVHSRIGGYCQSLVLDARSRSIIPTNFL